MFYYFYLLYLYLIQTPLYYVLSVIIFLILTFKTLQWVLNNKVNIKSLESYKNKVVIVTGASGGIGEKIAFKYAELGSKVAIVARRVELLEKLKKDIVKQLNIDSKQILVVQCDLCNENECEQMIERVVREWNRIDICVWNAGVGSLIEFDKLDQIESRQDRFKIFRDNMEINYFSLVYCTSFALPYLKQQKGSIVVVSSLAGKYGTPLRTSYSASKHAVQGFFNSLRNELSNQIQISIICPGFVLTDFHQKVATIDGKPIERESHSFMTADQCATIVLKTERCNKREVIPQLKAKVGTYLQPILPELVDVMTNKVAKGSLKNK
ncbi:short-chain dehydrogenase/reductase (SDR) family protein [Tieghemostelium lacteum]|uniref:Short-chain dehydrogenase/reductase (SDR) family protein n=1 Tax=Tieghemostelium lacteum TaxID=361077 RepID=A0A151Z8Z9_TIELA|nr:short-chain dehydrogenase/reductase (SDR) family protein [Tieghemostelium lacteum]|eukprot:KYQ90417.1 short-chain dehydrogenase/reductase (SDR) family protein [Tieghemostelium lacteum]